MLFTRAAEYLTNAIRPPTLTVGPPKRRRAWVLPRHGDESRCVEVKLEDLDGEKLAVLMIIDQFAPAPQRVESVSIVLEEDFATALDRVKAHTEP